MRKSEIIRIGIDTKVMLTYMKKDLEIPDYDSVIRTIIKDFRRR